MNGSNGKQGTRVTGTDQQRHYVVGTNRQSIEALERFQSVAEDLKHTLASLQLDDFIGDCDDHAESWSGGRHIDRVYIKSGLTFKGQDKTQWPE